MSTDAAAKAEFQGERLRALEDAAAIARSAARIKEVALLRERANQLQQQARVLHEETLPKFGEALDVLIPDLLLTFEIGAATRRWV
jgi:hypothetical protein